MCEALRWKSESVAQRHRPRLAEVVAVARGNSPYYRELPRGLPDRIDDSKLLPVTDKKKLMARFDQRPRANPIWRVERWAVGLMRVDRCPKSDRSGRPVGHRLMPCET